MQTKRHTDVLKWKIGRYTAPINLHVGDNGYIIVRHIYRLVVGSDAAVDDGACVQGRRAGAAAGARAEAMEEWRTKQERRKLRQTIVNQAGDDKCLYEALSPPPEPAPAPGVSSASGHYQDSDYEPTEGWGKWSV